MKTKSLIIVLGPTAIGKTSVAIDLAKHYKTEIISCDSRQFYKELIIGAAPPSKEQLKITKHHFIHHLSVCDDYNAGKFEIDAITKIEKLFEKNNKIIMAGGSGLYIDAISYGIDKTPNISDQIREKIINLYNVNGIQFLQKEIENKDPMYFEKVDIQNPQRLMRALGVIYQTNKPYSSFMKNKKKERDFNVIKIGLEINREKLYSKINKRVDNMIKEGLIEEVRSLIDYKNKNALQTVGYKEIFEYIDGKLKLDEAIDKIKRNTRRFAKRQITWFNKDTSINYFNPGGLDKIINSIE